MCHKMSRKRDVRDGKCDNGDLNERGSVSAGHLAKSDIVPSSPTVPPLRELRPDCIGQWLPWALASIHAAVVAASGAQPPDLPEILRAWTLCAMADAADEAESEAADRAFGAGPGGHSRNDPGILPSASVTPLSKQPNSFFSFTCFHVDYPFHICYHPPCPPPSGYPRVFHLPDRFSPPPNPLPSMSYGRTPRRGHSRRKPAHRWAEDTSFLDRREPYYREDHLYGRPCYVELGNDIAILVFMLAFLVLCSAGWLLVFLVSRLFRLAKRRRSQAEAFEETCRQHLRRRRTECVRGEPTPEQLLVAWEESRTSLAGKLRLGALLSEIEPHVDQSLIRDEAGHIVGRRPGILGWLRWNCPELVPHYKAIMAYKALADKVQMATGLQSKYSIVDVIDVFIEFGYCGAAAGGGAGAEAGSGAGESASVGAAEGSGAAADESAGATEGAGAGVGGPLGHRPLPAKGQTRRDIVFGDELWGPREKLREVLWALTRRTMRALDCEVCYRLGLMKTKRAG